ncbi:hypothetical protein CkaCkLH20_07597 [Colletotrichum karsti]|uniref:BZIP domain-containing protein n=1 Tax=Colletotrichum karsti TaxID=1095194 RepID=A0A9P6LIR3_9PEZI|nr:uncharacterized protein CkaCkLH20_07597 [Colletotrichum karsti]KAF9874903.1 hypothetical protein CkaCkLH20_07597 [Colletotrichum karsti]
MSSEQDYQDLFGPQAKKAKRGREQLQTDKSANAIRIRDNQRRSRARHKEFVDELQRKVQEYEKRGVEATVQMQKAARDVSIENARLKSLLASRGVSAEQIEAYLRSFDDDDSKGSPAVAPAIPVSGQHADGYVRPIEDESKMEGYGRPVDEEMRESPAAPLAAVLPPILNNPVVVERSSNQLPPLQEHFSKARFPPESENDVNGHVNGTKRRYGETLLPPVLTLTPTPDVQQNSPLDKLTMLANASLNSSNQSTPPKHQKIRENSRSPYLYGRRSQTPPRPTESHHPSQASPHEMSCNAAARIIADMQGYGDERTARIALGCRTQDDECFVRNTTVFRALDHR